MALVIEDGTIIAGAESYVDVTSADTYHSNRSNAAWAAATTANKEAALRKAAAYLDGHYRNRWKGCRVQTLIQPLEWPRESVVVQGGYTFPSNSIPQRLKDAQCELALRALSGDLATDAANNVRREKIDVIETEYFAGTTNQVVYTAVEQLISDYLKNSNNLMRG